MFICTKNKIWNGKRFNNYTAADYKQLLYDIGLVWALEVQYRKIISKMGACCIYSNKLVNCPF
jgi:hypothetical protein